MKIFTTVGGEIVVECPCGFFVLSRNGKIACPKCGAELALVAA